MSFQAVSWIMTDLTKDDINSTQCAILVAIADATASNIGICWLSQVELCSRAKIQKTDTLRQNLDQLVAAGLVDEYQTKYKDTHRRWRNMYVLACFRDTAEIFTEMKVRKGPHVIITDYSTNDLIPHFRGGSDKDTPISGKTDPHLRGDPTPPETGIPNKRNDIKQEGSKAAKNRTPLTHINKSEKIIAPVIITDKEKVRLWQQVIDETRRIVSNETAFNNWCSNLAVLEVYQNRIDITLTDIDSDKFNFYRNRIKSNYLATMQTVASYLIGSTVDIDIKYTAHMGKVKSTGTD